VTSKLSLIQHSFGSLEPHSFGPAIATSQGFHAGRAYEFPKRVLDRQGYWSHDTAITAFPTV
jgi:hypothetical protein